MDSEDAAIVWITDSNGHENYTNLDTNGTFTVRTDLGTNVIEIKDGKVYVSEADCPDKLCVKQGPISKAGETIVCLPHKLVVRITSNDFNDEPTYDAVTY